MASAKVNPEKRARVSAKDLGASAQKPYGERKEDNGGERMLTAWISPSAWSAVESLKAKWGLKDNVDVVERALLEASRTR
jgi:hypothetical protein